ncbi:C4-dicarboxylate transporter DcuC [Pragia fontium]|uniref:C4-dicarboxylate transporter, DcuC family n=2 Tax=Pragia fontium TaxID=82985 RepID=A0AAJ4W9I3_9GAMM|nr:C4-dicarboxylate transporter DcuC [Pragia fontium]AKJ42068.1 C4-dicarboxylate ABC transporter [Pragia fontium]SFC47531.1 C4-dicarboxylate transporter, DcuC family [Pragia fontium DSM 5563 = ATCC 49100]SUB82304.1 Putative cryptic C4-dicarboxylate transporter DcuD [Pragia fontium]VEJ55134.1 Putative cryptic C4-dicarboxylate transporter DcuD [Pragia fontium]GKX61899.1 anaerobic C4-dicarboxylate transporter DcuC [Pragia fontium]
MLQIIALVVVAITIFLLIKQYETRMVLIGSGLIMCLLALSPMAGLDAFSERMTSGSLIQAICASMGFAYVMKYTQCDMHLVRTLAGMMNRLGFFLIPATVIVTYIINTAIPSAAGCAAAVGATLIPLLIGARIHPAIAAAAVLSGTIGSFLSPGMSHNAFVSNLFNEVMQNTADFKEMSVMDLIGLHAPYSVAVGLIGAVSLSVVALVRKEYRITPSEDAVVAQGSEEKEQVKANYLYATAPFIPLILLLIAGLTDWFGAVKMSVPAAMVIGAIYALLITRCNPTTMTKQFFNGMGNAYGDVLGIIIAAAVFAAGLKTSGLIDSFIYFLTHNPELARWGGTIGPFLMGIITGSGDAAALAFNETVTRSAAALGYTIPDMGMAAAISGALGRTMSPIAGVTIVCAGLAAANPVEVIKRTAPGMIIGVIFIALFML